MTSIELVKFSLAYLVFAGVLGLIFEQFKIKKNKGSIFHRLEKLSFGSVAIAFVVFFVCSVSSYENYETLGLGNSIDKIYVALGINVWGSPFLLGCLFTSIVSMFFVLIAIMEFLHLNNKHRKILNSVNVNLSTIDIYLNPELRLAVNLRSSKFEKYIPPQRYAITFREQLKQAFGFVILFSLLSWIGFVCAIGMIFYSFVFLIKTRHISSEEAALIALGNTLLSSHEKEEILRKFVPNISSLL